MSAGAVIPKRSLVGPSDSWRPWFAGFPVTIQGQPYAIVDIGMRMLTPRERFSAQGFRASYVIDRGELEDGTVVPLTLEQQGRMCGNSACPPMAQALVSANYREADVRPRRAADAAPIPLFAAE